MKRILIDSDALIALVKEDDSNHSKALLLSEKINKDSVYITPFVISEVATIISYKIGQKEAGIFLREIRRKKLTEVALTKDLINKTDEIFLSQNKKGTSWVDCLNVAAVKILDLDGIFSFDGFYRQMKITLFN